ncbi:MAG: hypothetical protein Q4B63_07785 [Clostridium perfringens]|nr:hypothetical protein [Clostridium perfringens]
MSKKKFKLKILIIPIIIIVIIFGGAFFTYENYFAPKVPVTSVNTSVNLESSVLDFIPSKASLSLSEVVLNSNGMISDTNLTDLIILVLQNVSNTTLKEITGVQVKIVDNEINVYATFNYLDIPFEVHFVLIPQIEDNQAVLHYVKGNIGFIQIPKSLVFKYLSNKSFMSVDSSKANIILKFDNLDKLNINTFEIDGSSLKIAFTTTLNLTQINATKIVKVSSI